MEFYLILSVSGRSSVFSSLPAFYHPISGILCPFTLSHGVCITISAMSYRTTDPDLSGPQFPH